MGYNHDGRSKFKQDGSYKTKDFDSTRDDWRDRKGFTRDQGKHRTWCKCGRLLKTWGNRQNRRWAAKLIKSEKYDNIYFHQDMFVSSWDAC
jgi:hypothetical protein